MLVGHLLYMGDREGGIFELKINEIELKLNNGPSME